MNITASMMTGDRNVINDTGSGFDSQLMMYFMFNLRLVGEANENSLIGLDENLTANVFDINTAKRLCRSVICTLDVDAFGIGFAFDEVAGFDAFQCDSLHGVVYLR